MLLYIKNVQALFVCAICTDNGILYIKLDLVVYIGKWKWPVKKEVWKDKDFKDGKCKCLSIILLITKI